MSHWLVKENILVVCRGPRRRGYWKYLLTSIPYFLWSRERTIDLPLFSERSITLPSISFPSGSVISFIRGLWILVGVGLAFVTTPSSRVFSKSRVPTGYIPTTLIKIFSKIGSKAALLFFIIKERSL